MVNIEQVKSEVSGDNAKALVLETYQSEVKDFRSKCVSADNARTPYARRTFALLANDTLSPKHVIETLLATFDNPKTPKGKVLTKITSSSADYVTGFGTARKTCALVLELWECAKCDETVLVMVNAFAALPMDSYRKEDSLTALDRAICDYLKASVPPVETVEPSDDSDASDASDASDSGDTSEPKAFDVVQASQQFTVAELVQMARHALNCADKSELEAANPFLAELYEAIARVQVPTAIDIAELQERFAA